MTHRWSMSLPTAAAAKDTPPTLGSHTRHRNNRAGSFHMGNAVQETHKDPWDLMLDINARPVIDTARAVVPGMIDAGYEKIVNIAALAAFKSGI